MGIPWHDGHWLVADRQSSGRGRLGRAWNDGAGNFMGSVTLALRANDPPAHSLALVAAIALYDAITDMAALPALRIKWPNDLMVGGAKLAGILLERAGDHVVVGMGVNIRTAPAIAGRETVSLVALDCGIARDDLSEALAGRWSAAIAAWRSGEWPDAILARWTSAAHPRGTRLTLTEGEHRGLTGQFDGLEQDGALALLLDDGRRVIVHAGDIALV